MFKKLSLSILLIIAATTLTGCISLKSKPTVPAAENPNINGGIFKSEDRGEIWSQKVLVPSVTGQPGSIAAVNTSVLERDPSDSKALYLGTVGNGLFYTYDGAATWQTVPQLGQITVTDIAIDPKNKCTIYVATGNRVLKTSDCSRNWEQVYYDNELNIAVNTIDIDSLDTAKVYIGLSRGEVIRSLDFGESWNLVNRFRFEVQNVLVSPHDSNVIFVATGRGGIYRTTDGGTTWEDLTKNLTDFGYTQYKDMAFSPSNPGTIFLATKYGLFKSTDNGDNWENFELLTPETRAIINVIDISPKDPNEIYYATNTTFYRSVDGGQNWATKKLPTTRAGKGMVVDPENPNIIYLGLGLPGR